MADSERIINVEDLVTVRQASKRYGIPVRTLYRWISQGKLTSLAVGGRIVLHIEELEKSA